MNKLCSTAKKLDIFFRVIQIVFSIAAVASLVFLGIIGAGFLFNWDPDIIGTGYDLLELGCAELQIAADYAPDPKLVLIETAVMLALSFMCMVIGRVSITYIRQILQPMIEGAPFHSIISTNLKKLALLGMILGIVFNCIGLAECLMLTFAYDLPNLLLCEKITHITINYNFDFSFLALCAILLLLSYIFRYGEELQKLSDETL